LCGGVLVRRFALKHAQACFGEKFQAHVAAGFGPFVGLFHRHRPDKADDRAAIGEDPDHVGAPADLLVPSLYAAFGDKKELFRKALERYT
jgi:hypothetical protein